MTIQQAPRRRVAPSLLSALTVLALGVWTHPAFSATGTDARCDQSLDSPSMSIADNRKLPLQVIDHGATGTAAAGDISFDDTDVDPTTKALPGPEQTADLSPPLVVDQSKSIEDPAAGLEADPVDSPAALPGFSADELHRYRKQMYRTDI